MTEAGGQMHFSSIPQWIDRLQLHLTQLFRGLCKIEPQLPMALISLETQPFSPILFQSFQSPNDDSWDHFPNKLHAFKCLSLVLLSEGLGMLCDCEPNGSKCICLLGFIFKELCFYESRRRLLKWILKVIYANPLNASRPTPNNLK